jgi:hypothetical protein
MPIHHDHKLIHVEVPKTGGSTIEQLLGNPCKREDNARFYGTVRGAAAVFLSGTPDCIMTHLTATEIARAAPYHYHAYRKFMVVRDPFTRLESEYRYLLGLAGKMGEPGVVLDNLPYHVRSTFRDFVETLVADHGSGRVGRMTQAERCHLVPQSDYLPPPGDGVTVFKFEDFPSAARSVMGMAGLPAPVSIPVVNATDKGSTSLHDAYTAAATVDLYRADFEAFGYGKKHPFC